MLPSAHDRSRPAGNQAASNVITDGNATSLAPTTLTLVELDALAAHVDGAFVVVVKVSGERYHRRCYLTAKAAENAARKATDRGENATVYMAELKPLWRLVGGSR